jgi:hypothetical protein
MTFILAKERDIDPAIAFRKYSQYLLENKSRFPTSAYDLATSDWWYDFNSHKCPHDSWLETAKFDEASTGERSELRKLSLTLRLLNANHDGHIELVYSDVTAYRLAMPSVDVGHGDWRYDEFCVNDKGQLVHEIEWASSGQSGAWIIEASDIYYRWLPF